MAVRLDTRRISMGCIILNRGDKFNSVLKGSGFQKQSDWE
jgi:hypothetical protein